MESNHLGVLIIISIYLLPEPINISTKAIITIAASAKGLSTAQPELTHIEVIFNSPFFDCNIPLKEYHANLYGVSL
jgi:hypothetical protein